MKKDNSSIIKQSQINKASIIQYILCALMVTVGIFFFIILSKVSYFTNRKAPDIKHISFIGTYQDNIASKPHNITNKSIADISTKKALLLKGHFSEDISANEDLFFFLRELKIIMKVNGEVTYTYGYNYTSPINIKSVGTLWGTAYSPSISKTDDIELYVESIYPKFHKASYKLLLDNICVGKKDKLLNEAISNNLLHIIIGIIILILGLAFLIAIFTVKIFGVDVPNGYFACGLLLICGAMCTLIDYDYITLIFSNAYSKYHRLYITATNC